MPTYEYKVVPAPTKGQKARGVKTPEGRFAVSVESVLNAMGADGWEYLRAELLPSDERSGLTGSAVHWRNVLVFRRPQPGDAEQFQPRLLDPPEVPAPAPQAEADEAADARIEPRLATGAERMLKDNGVEEISDVSGMTTALIARAEQQSDVDEDAADLPDAADDSDDTVDEITGDDDKTISEDAPKP